MGQLTKLVRRVRGAGDVLRPAIDRWHIARASERAGNVAALPFEDRIYPRRTKGTETDPVARAAPYVRPAQNRADGIASVAEPVSRRDAHEAIVTDATEPGSRSQPREVNVEAIAALPSEPERNATIVGRSARRAGDRAASRQAPVAYDAVERSRPERGGGEPRLLPPRAVRPPNAVRPVNSAFEGMRSKPPSNEPGPVYVHIGRIDVRAVSAPAVKTPVAPRPAMHKPSLEAHLRARDRGAG